MTNTGTPGVGPSSPTSPQLMFTPQEVETAIRVLMETKLVKNWAHGIARFMEIDPESAAGKNYLKRRAYKIAKKIILG